MNEATIRQVMDHLPVGTAVFCIDEDDYGFLYANEYFTDRFAMSGDDIAKAMKSDLARIIHPEDVERIQLMLYKGSVTGGRFGEIVRVKRGENYIWADIRMNTSMDDDGRILLVFSIIEVDNQKENELRLEKIYEELLGVMNYTPGGIVVFDTKNNRDPFPVFISSGMYRMLEGSKQQISDLFGGSDYVKAIHPDDREIVVRTVEDALRNISDFHFTIRLRTVPGEYILTDVNGVVVASEGSRKLYVSYVNASGDRETQILLQHILDLLVSRQYDSICQVNAKENSYCVLSSNASKNEAFLRESNDYQETVNSMIDRFVAKDERAELKQELRLDNICKKLDNQADLECYITMHFPDGIRYKKLWICWANADNRQLAFVLSDLTELRRQQTEQQNTILNALQAAEQANIAKSVFLSRMSHDIRTPLNAIIGFTDMCLTEGKTDENTVDWLQKIETSSRYLLSLVNDVLDMSRIESGKYTLRQDLFSVRKLLDSVSSIILAQCLNKKLVFQCKLSENIREIYVGDRLKLQQVLVNILGNSVKFTPPGGRIEIFAEETACLERQVMLRFSVRDTGVGMDKNFLPHVFETFTQESANNGARQEIGTGLGLAICKSIVSLMKGEIAVSSEKGKGTEFVVSVRLGIPEGELSGRSVPVNTEVHTYDFSGQHVLLAEDNRLNQEIAKHLLEKVHVAVDIVPNGQAAVDRFEESAPGKYDLILMDIRMPVMDGIEAARGIRNSAHPGAATVPIVAMSADAFEEDISKSLLTGINAYLVKPIDRNAFYSTLGKFLKHK